MNHAPIARSAVAKTGYTDTHGPISLQERNLLTEERINFFLYFFLSFFSLDPLGLIGHVNDSRDAEKGLLKYDNLPRRLPEPCLYVYIYIDI